ncbi:MAG: copper resistance protein CopC/CopD, partial [Armatimonadetes bacterium]|nr:copper resistance protein CopC/CopD [Anaerolineae bacterium]
MRRVLLFSIVLILSVHHAAPLQAHANLQRSAPAANTSLSSAPDAIRLWFTEPIEPQFSRITLRDSTGALLTTPAATVDAADAHQLILVPGALSDGLYTVVWRVVSAADGHPTEGSFAFGVNVSVNAPTSQVITEVVIPLESVGVRWLNLLSIALVMGTLGFALFVLRPVDADVLRYAAVRRLLWGGWGLLGVAGALVLLLQVSLTAETTLIGALAYPRLGQFISSTTFGGLWLARMALWLLLGVCLLRGWQWAALATSAALILAHSLFSHAAAAQDTTASIAGAWLHLTTSALWVGGLVAFVVVLWARRSISETAITGRLVAYFSSYVRVTVAALALSGLYAAWLHVGSIQALFDTAYGRALIVKSALFLPLLAIAVVNLLLTQRRLNAGEAVWEGRLRGLVGIEIALAAGGILTAAALMTAGSPARGVIALREALAAEAPAEGYFGMQTVNDQMLHLEIV